jgi:hypothetical protein
VSNETTNPTPFESGDQNPSWDASLKLAVLAHLGHQARHEVHTADLFSRGPEGSTTVQLTHETYRPDGNVTRWTASLEACPFLGRMPISPNELTDRGVDFGLIAWSQKCDLAKAVAGITAGDWVGVSAPSDTRVAHGISTAEIRDMFPRIRKAMLGDMNQALHPDTHPRVTEVIDRFWNFGSSPMWTETAIGMVQRQLEFMGAANSVDLTTSVDTYRQPSRLFELFVENYDAARAAYNRAVKCPGEFIGTLDEGQLPFYAIVNHGGNLVRVDLDWNRGDSVESVLRRAAHRYGEVITVLGKSVPHLVEVWMRGPAILPEKGSAYYPKSIRFARFLQESISEDLGLHPMHRLRFHALNALQKVEAEFRLPEYLREAFGTEWITGREFGEKWWDAQKAARERANALTGKFMQNEASKLVTALCELGVIGAHARDEYLRLEQYVRNTNAKVGTIFEAVNRAQDDERKRLEAAAPTERERITREYAPNIFTDAIRGAWGGLEVLRAREIAKQIAITSSLKYWNARPYGHWVLSVPGWFDAIKCRAELVVDPALNDASLLE